MLQAKAIADLRIRSAVGGSHSCDGFQCFLSVVYESFQIMARFFSKTAFKVSSQCMKLNLLLYV